MLSGLNSSETYGANTVKQRIALNFSRAAHSYDQAATFQKKVAANVMELLPETLPVSSVLDMGTGTGVQCRQLSEKYPDAATVGMDMAMGMLRHAHSQHDGVKNLHWCSGDIEALPFVRRSFDLVCSSLAIQWCSLSKVLAEVSRVLKPGGHFVFSSLAKNSLYELDSAWQAINEPFRVNQFDAFERQSGIIRQGVMEIGSLTVTPEVLYYPDVFSLLRALKSLGVNTVLAGQQGLMTRRKLHGLRQAYEIYRTKAGLPLTYQVIYGVLKKKSY